LEISPANFAQAECLWREEHPTREALDSWWEQFEGSSIPLVLLNLHMEKHSQEFIPDDFRKCGTGLSLQTDLLHLTLGFQRENQLALHQINLKRQASLS
jgi:hypothetical protein